MELHRTIADEPNVQFVLAGETVGPAARGDAAGEHRHQLARQGGRRRRRLAARLARRRTLRGDLADRLEAAGLNAAQNAIDASKANELDEVTERRARGARSARLVRVAKLIGR